MSHEIKPKQSAQKPSFWQIVISTLAAAFGVQSTRNQERDFNHGNIYAYIGAGIIFTLVFIGIVSVIVQAVLSHHGL